MCPGNEFKFKIPVINVLDQSQASDWTMAQFVEYFTLPEAERGESKLLLCGVELELVPLTRH